MKIGILTHYYNTHNYGGILQAYALVEFLNKNGFDAEQICFKLNLRQFTYKDEPESEVRESHGFLHRVIKSIKYRYKYYLIGALERLFFERYTKKYLVYRYENFAVFQNNVIHSKKVYKEKNITDALKEYDCFIVGSDQVWNFECFTPVFYLEFADATKRKIAYAASAGASDFSEEEVSYLKTVLPSFNAISVRESELVDRYKEMIGGISPQFVLDPVFLIDVDDWDKLLGKRLIKNGYVFSFFLGDDAEMKTLARQYAKRKNLDLVLIPFCRGFNKSDIKRGDTRINIAGPKEFVSLIKYADCVFSDSFHATAFSIIFKRDFFVFERKDFRAMRSRIKSITRLVKCEESFCDSDYRRTLEYVIAKKTNTYDESTTELEMLKNASKKFLVSAIFES